MQKLLITRPLPASVINAALARFDVTLRDTTAPLSAEELRIALTDFDAVLPTLGDRFQADVFEMAGFVHHGGWVSLVSGLTV